MSIGSDWQFLNVLRARGAAVSLSYGLGRFHAVRRGYGIGNGLVQRWRGTAGDARGAPSIFPPIDVTGAAAALRETAFYAGLQIPAGDVAEIVRMARESPLRPPTRADTFRYDDVRAGRLPNGEHAILSVVMGAERHPLVRRIAEDAQVNEIVRRNLGYWPASRDVRLMWSFVSDCSDDTRRAATQTIDYHFDVHHFSFVYANYYLLDTDARSGAHAMILGSHSDKPTRWLLRSARQSDAAIQAHYGKARELVIEGRAGYGFMQDASCYHKALAPVDGERLLLQIRYW